MYGPYAPLRDPVGKAVVREVRMPAQIPELLSYNQTAQQLHIHRSTLSRLVTDGEIRSVTIGGRRFFTARAIADFISEHES